MDKFDSYDLKYSPLIGRPLAGVEVIDDRGAIRFTFIDGTDQIYDAWGDCCSSTWIEHISVPPDLYGFAIFDITEPQLPPHPATSIVADDEDGDTIQVYHTAFATSAGHILVEYRNSSNGYYGGGLRGPR
jgi:hypothetical protein